MVVKINSFSAMKFQRGAQIMWISFVQVAYTPDMCQTADFRVREASIRISKKHSASALMNTGWIFRFSAFNRQWTKHFFVVRLSQMLLIKQMAQPRLMELQVCLFALISENKILCFEMLSHKTVFDLLSPFAYSILLLFRTNIFNLITFLCWQSKLYVV